MTDPLEYARARRIGALMYGLTHAYEAIEKMDEALRLARAPGGLDLKRFDNEVGMAAVGFVSGLEILENLRVAEAEDRGIRRPPLWRDPHKISDADMKNILDAGRETKMVGVQMRAPK